MFTTEETTFSDIYFFQFPSYIFKDNQAIVEENNPSEKNVAEELDGIDIDDIGNFLRGNKGRSSMKNV